MSSVLPPEVVPDVFDPCRYAAGVPYDDYRVLRDRHPVARQEEPGAPGRAAGPGFWAVTRHADVVRVLADTVTYSSSAGGTRIGDPDPADLPFLRRLMAGQDPPGHGRLRRSAGRALTPERVDRFARAVRERARALCAGALVTARDGDGTVDAVTAVTDEFALLNLADLLGVPPGDRRWLHRVRRSAGGPGGSVPPARQAATGRETAGGPDTAVTRETAGGRETAAARETAVRPDRAAGRETTAWRETASRPDTAVARKTAARPETAADRETGTGRQAAADRETGTGREAAAWPVEPWSVAALEDLCAYARQLAAYKRRYPADDVLTTLAYDAELTGAELEMLFVLFTVAGCDTVRAAAPGGLLVLAEHPGEYGRLSEGRVPTAAAVDELLRLHPPVLTRRRTAAEDTELAGQRIRAGDKVVVFLASANRDERVFTAPGRPDLARTPNPQVSFGGGPHACLGARFARLQLTALYTEWARLLPAPALAGPPVRSASNAVNGVESLPLRLL
ncbi:cytochrome P450 [Streptomyces sp. NPDC026672]|uniref:cytochrome P450 n=1 Tax=unclassified Streptomyces TaxID=2593676 RepID=UPI0033F9F4A1